MLPQKPLVWLTVRTSLIFILIFLSGCASFSRGPYTSRNASQDEIIGIWKVVQLPNSLQPHQLKEDPWPGGCQYIAFYAGGALKVWNNVQEPCDIAKLVLEKRLDQVSTDISWRYDYSKQYKQGVIFVTPGRMSKLEVWDPRFVLSKWSRDGVEFAPGELTLYMGNIDTGRGRILWIKHLQPVK